VKAREAGLLIFPQSVGRPGQIPQQRNN